MGTFTDDNNSPNSLAASDHAIRGEEGKVNTDVEGIFADGEKMGLPVFNVDHNEFHQKTEFGRKRLVFKPEAPVQQYMQKSQVNRPFWLATKDNTGQTWTKKIS